jgi:hypothetical protein
MSIDSADVTRSTSIEAIALNSAWLSAESCLTMSLLSRVACIGFPPLPPPLASSAKLNCSGPTSSSEIWS